MRPTALAALIGLAIGIAVGCVDFDLDGRRYKCTGQPEICDDGWVCGADGYCALPGAVDAAPPDAVDLCPDFPQQTMCGAGCACEADGAHEIACGDGNDNDEDGDVDCHDDDCPACMGGTTCCPNGLCQQFC